MNYRIFSNKSLLDLSAAYDTVDHPHNLSQRVIWPQWSCVDWLESFVINRTQVVTINGASSTLSVVTCGVPQGSVLGPILFMLYTADVLNIAKKHNLDAHSYADDSQLYCHVNARNGITTISQIVACIDDINLWMSPNRLKSNTNKTEFIWLGTSKQLSKINCNGVMLDGDVISKSSKVKLSRVTLNRQLSFAAHLKKLCNICFYYLWLLRTVRRLPTLLQLRP